MFGETTAGVFILLALEGLRHPFPRFRDLGLVPLSLLSLLEGRSGEASHINAPLAAGVDGSSRNTQHSAAFLDAPLKRGRNNPFSFIKGSKHCLLVARRVNRLYRLHASTSILGLHAYLAPQPRHKASTMSEVDCARWRRSAMTHLIALGPKNRPHHYFGSSW